MLEHLDTVRSLLLRLFILTVLVLGVWMHNTFRNRKGDRGIILRSKAADKVTHLTREAVRHKCAGSETAWKTALVTGLDKPIISWLLSGHTTATCTVLPSRSDLFVFSRSWY